MKIVFMGTPEFARPILKSLAEKYEVVLVVTQADKLKGRKQIPTFSPVKEEAIALNIPVFQPLKLKDDIETIMNADADVLVTAAYGQFVPTKVLNKFKRCINVHGSLLPKRRGGAPIQRSIIEGDSVTGVTIMQMVKGMDKGVMYSKVELPILDSDNQDTIFEKLSYLGRDLLMESIEDIYSGKNAGIPQNEEEATISPNISPWEEEFNFNSSARDIFNKVRGLSHEPGAYFVTQNTRVKVYSCAIVETDSKELPGTVLQDSKRLIIKCADKAIEILTLKVEGKKEMDARSFLNGQKLFTKSSLI
ncbi:MAG: methionyl-tRNA formyltransferase [Acholeplasmatales bacterium]|nr:methionyl-tRNA formyltransferase [Acholeplasmatales bacterium]